MRYAKTILLLLLLLTAGCDDRQLDNVLATADSLITASPDSAFHYLEAHSTLKPEGSRSQRMRYELLRATAQNKAYIDFTTDSVMKQVADYYDHHGTANEQLQAHYLLGCVYRDLGDAPRAIECYLDAVEKADTTAEDCDYKVLGRVYSQMANMYHRQLLLNNEIKARKQATHYSYIARDTLRGINDYKMMAGVYILLNKVDSAEIILKESINNYLKLCENQQALQTSTMLMHIYEKQPSRQQELGDLINKYDEDCCLFDSLHDLPPSKRQYFYHKAKYLENCQQYDSAEYYYRKIYRTGMSHVQKDPMYRGLLSVFQKKHQADSIAKYAALFAEANDSSIAIKDRELTAQMTATYNYSLYQKEALKEEQRAHQWKVRVIVLVIIIVASFLVVAYWNHMYKLNRRKVVAMFNATLSERNQLQKELENLKDRNYAAVIEQKENKIKELNQSIDIYATIYQQVKAKDHLADFERSDIVRQFAQMAEFRKGMPLPGKREWKRLVTEFSKHLPSAYAMMTRKETALSELQLHVCILLLLDYDEGVIATLREAKPQTVNSAKVRANQKLFQTKDSASLKDNLCGLLSQ